MPTRTEAEEHLRIIRSLMEKATIYRAISAPTALVGGLLSVLAAFLFSISFSPPMRVDRHVTQRWFLITWLAVLGLTAAANTYFIWKDAQRRGDPFLSKGMRLALLSLLPPFVCAAFATFVLAGGAYLLPPAWMISYGLGLLATCHFAPRSIGILGWAFLIAGCFITIQMSSWDFYSMSGMDHLAPESNESMAFTFGLFHIIYAACTWSRKPAANSGGEA